MKEEAADVSSKTPLVTTTVYADLVTTNGYLPIPTQSSSTLARRVEESCGIPPSRYFYAGRAHPSFGDCAFAFSPEIEAKHQGCASPFDTGGVYKGYTHPLKHLNDQSEMIQRARALITTTRVKLDEWRLHFADFLLAFYSTPQNYLDRCSPDLRKAWGPEDLPARHQENSADWRAWSWEIRLHENHPVHQHLMAWSCTREVHVSLINSRIADDLPPLQSSSAPLDILLTGHRPLAGNDFSMRIEEHIRAMVLP